MDLREWNNRLAAHFTDLRQHRAETVPIFALEHSLGSAEIEELNAAIRSHVKWSSPSIQHRYAWIVYAAELGYRYAGDEYWQTFEAETPGWVNYSRRDW